MADFGGDGLASAAAVGIGGFVLIRKWVQYRRRAVNPDMVDPAPSYRVQWNLALGALTLAVVVLAVAVARAWEGLGLFLSAVLLIAAIVGAVLGYVLIWMAAENRRHATGYVICEAQYLAAPAKIKASMRRIYKSRASLQAGTASECGMLPGAEIDRLVYEAARRALLSAELATAVRELSADARAEDNDALGAANAKLQEIQNELIDVEKRLTRSSAVASKLSQRLAEPEKKRAREDIADRLAAESTQRRSAARARLDEAAARAASLDSKLDAGDVEERISAVHAGYEEVVTLSGGLIGTPDPQPELVKKASAETNEMREDIAKAVKASALKAGKLSGAAAKWGAARIREWNDTREPASKPSQESGLTPHDEKKE